MRSFFMYTLVINFLDINNILSLHQQQNRVSHLLVQMQSAEASSIFLFLHILQSFFANPWWGSTSCCCCCWARRATLSSSSLPAVVVRPNDRLCCLLLWQRRRPLEEGTLVCQMRCVDLDRIKREEGHLRKCAAIFAFCRRPLDHRLLRLPWWRNLKPAAAGGLLSGLCISYFIYV